MTLSNEKRRERYQNDVEYRNKILEKCRKKYNDDEEFRNKKIDYAIQYDKNHPSDKKDYLKEYYIENSDHLKSKTKFNRVNKRNEVIYWYSNGDMRCECCGENCFEFLCVDHIEND